METGFRFSVILALGLGLAAAASEVPDAPDYLANPPPGFVPDGPAQKYSGSRLFDYMNGGAELYLAYGFTDIHVRSFHRGDQAAKVEIYVMGSPAEAFGIFSHGSRGAPVDIGLRGVQGRNMVSFHKGHHYVRVVAATAEPEAELLVTVARHLAAALPGASTQPDEVSLLPPGAQAGSLRYLTKPQTGRTLWFEGEESVVLNDDTSAVSAFYEGDDGDVQLTRIGYTSPEAARQACRALALKLSLQLDPTKPECNASGTTPDDMVAAIGAVGPVLRWVGGATNEATAANWLNEIK